MRERKQSATAIEHAVLAEEAQRIAGARMSKQAHSALPWHIEPNMPNRVTSASSVTLLETMNRADGMGENNAAYIVRAVNSHEALMHIARELSVWEADPDRYGGDLANLAHEARAALDAAEGER